MSTQTFITAEELRARMRFGTEDRLARILNLDDGAPLEEHPALASAISDAAAEIQGALLARYKAPFRPVPPLVSSLAAALAVAHLLARRPELITDGDRDSAKWARDTLGHIASGKVILEFPPVDATRELVPAVPVTLGYGRDEKAQTNFERALDSF